MRAYLVAHEDQWASELARRLGVTQRSIQQWRRSLLGGVPDVGRPADASVRARADRLDATAREHGFHDLTALIRGTSHVPIKQLARQTGLSPNTMWSASTRSHVGFESWLERELMMLDFDPDIVAVSSQLCWLHWSDAEAARRHAPDFFARGADGCGLVVDVRPDRLIAARDAEAFAVTARPVPPWGGGTDGVGQLDPVRAANVRWLAGYRHPRCSDQPRADRRLGPRPRYQPVERGIDSLGGHWGSLMTPAPPVRLPVGDEVMFAGDAHVVRQLSGRTVELADATGAITEVSLSALAGQPGVLSNRPQRNESPGAGPRRP
jgi:hypothetical protein